MNFCVPSKIFLERCCWTENEQKRSENKLSSLRFLVFVQTSMKEAVFWDVVPCISVDIYWRFEGAYWLHGQMSQDCTVQHPRRRPFANEPPSNMKISRWIYVLKSVTQSGLISWWNTMVMVMLMCWNTRFLTQDNIPDQRNLVCRLLINTVIVYVWLALSSHLLLGISEWTLPKHCPASSHSNPLTHFSCSLLIALMMEAVSTPETSASF
jgi:hypothetical protein